MPLIFPTLVVAMVAVLEWNRSVMLARVALGCAFTLLLAAVRDPGLSADEILAYYEDGLTYLMAIARVLGVGCFLVAASKVMRGPMLHDD